MEWNLNLDSQTINIITMLIVSALLGAIIGLEREITSKFAGLRTHILVCLGSTVFTILSIYSFPTITAEGNPVAFGDPARVAAQILTGIGFIGGGTVLRHGHSVYGLTTAATLWVAASIGMAVGAGEYLLGTASAILTVLILTAIRTFQRTVLKRISQRGANLQAIIKTSPEYVKSVINELNSKIENIEDLKHTKSKKDEMQEKIIITFNIFSQSPINDCYSILSSIKNIEDLSIKNISFE